MLNELLKAPSLWQFDLDETLIDSKEAHQETARAVIKELLKTGYHCSIDPEEATLLLSRTPVTKIVEEYFSSAISPEQARDLYLNTYLKKKVPAKVFDKAVEVLEFLKEKSQLIVFVTGGNKGIATENINAIKSLYPGLTIDGFVYDGIGIPVKPDPAPCQFLVDKLQINHPDIDFRRRVKVGDSPIDLKYAQNTQSKFIYVSGLKPDQKIQKQSDLTVVNMSDLYDHLTRYLKDEPRN